MKFTVTRDPSGSKAIHCLHPSRFFPSLFNWLPGDSSGVLGSEWFCCWLWWLRLQTYCKLRVYFWVSIHRMTLLEFGFIIIVVPPLAEKLLRNIFFKCWWWFVVGNVLIIPSLSFLACVYALFTFLKKKNYHIHPFQSQADFSISIATKVTFEPSFNPSQRKLLLCKSLELTSAYVYLIYLTVACVDSAQPFGLIIIIIYVNSTIMCLAPDVVS